MEHNLELISPILEIVDRTIHIQSYPGNSGPYDPYISPILEIVDRTIHISVLSWKYWIVRSIFAHMLSYIWIVRSIFAPMLMSRGVAGARRGSRGDGGGGGGDGDVPTTLPSGQSPGPSRPGTKYPVRGQSLTSTSCLFFLKNRDS